MYQVPKAVPHLYFHFHSHQRAQLKFTKGQAVSLVDPTYTPETVNSELTLTPGGNNTLAINAKSGTGVGPHTCS